MTNDYSTALQLTSVQRGLEPRADLVERRTGREDPRHPGGLQGGDVVVGNDPAHHEEHVVATLTLQEVHHARHEHEVGSRQERETERVGVFLDDGLHDLLGCLVESGIDDLEARVTQRSRDDLRATIVSVETWFGDYDSVRALHQSLSIEATPRTEICDVLTFG